MIFKEQFPEFDDINDDFIDILLSRATNLIDESAYSPYYELATFLVVAHDLELGRSKYLEFQSQVAAIRKGELIPSFISRSEEKEYWNLTTYGMQLQKLRNRHTRTGFSI
jgi:hypothetical protein